MYVQNQALGCSELFRNIQYENRLFVCIVIERAKNKCAHKNYQHFYVMMYKSCEIFKTMVLILQRLQK